MEVVFLVFRDLVLRRFFFFSKSKLVVFFGGFIIFYRVRGRFRVLVGISLMEGE